MYIHLKKSGTEILPILTFCSFQKTKNIGLYIILSHQFMFVKKNILTLD